MVFKPNMMAMMVKSFRGTYTWFSVRRRYGDLHLVFEPEHDDNDGEKLDGDLHLVFGDKGLWGLTPGEV